MPSAPPPDPVTPPVPAPPPRRGTPPHRATPVGGPAGPRHRPTAPGGPARRALTGTSARRGARLAVGAAVLGGVVAGLLAPGAAPPTPGSAPAPTTPPAALAVGPTALDPLGFGPGGCVALEPTGVARQEGTVLVDAGHGGPDPGTSALVAGAPVLEKDVTLAIARETATRLRARGYRVVLSRSTDDTAVRRRPGDLAGGALTLDGARRELGSRARCANLAGAAALVSIHANAYDDPTVRGTETLFDPSRPFGDRNQRLALLLQRSTLRALAAVGRPTGDRGVVGGPGSGTHGARTENSDLVVLAPADGLNVTEPSAMPGALVEPFFVSNPDDAAAAITPAGTGVLAGAVTAAVDQFLQEKA